MSVDLGAVVARVIVEDEVFRRSMSVDMQIMREFGMQAGRSAAGAASLDDGLIAVSSSASKASSSITRASRAVVGSASANAKDAKASIDNARAKERLAAFQAQIASMSTKEQQAALRSAAAQERVAEVNASSTASYRQLAAAEASALGATRALTTANKSAAVSSRATESAFGGLLHTAAQLGVVIGGIEVAKKVIEFVGAGRDLTSALNGVQAASHATNAQMGAVRREAIGLGKDLKVPAATAVDAADAMQDLVRSGMTLPRAMAATRSALLLASAAQVSTADGARYLGDILDDFGLSGDKAAHVANVLAGAATAAGGGLGDMFTAMKYAGPVARAAGGNVDELATAIALLAKSGIQGDQAGTGLRSMFLALAGPTKQQAAGFKALGITTKDAAGNLLPLPALIDKLHAAQERMNPADFLAAIKHAFGKPATSVVASFAHQGIEGYNRFAARVGSGDVQQYADLMNRGVSASMRQVRKELTAAGIDVYQKVEPAFAAAAMWLGQELPKAGHAAVAVLGGPLHVAWSALATVVGLAGDVIEPVIHLLDSPVGSAAATGVLAMWAAWKGFAIVSAAYQAVRSALIGMQVTAANGLNSFQAYGRGVVGVLEGNGTVAAATSAEMQAAMLTEAQAEIDAQVIRERAAAATAAAYADMVLASEDASAAMISSSQNAALAAQMQADATAAAAAEIATASEAAAAEVEAAGEAASVGWAGILGPIGLVAVGVATAASALGLFGSSAKNNTAEVEALTTAIQRDSDALGANTRQAVAHALAQGGALDAAQKLGLSVHDVTDAALHGGPALAALNQALGLFMAGSYGSAKGSAAQTRAARLLYAALNDQNQSVGEAVRHARQEAAATGASTHATETNSTAKQGNAAATNSNAAAIRKLISAELALINASLAQAQSQDQFLESVRATTTQLKSNNGSLSKNTAHGLANRDALLASVQAALSLKDAQDKAGGSVKAHTRTLADNIQNLRAAAIAAGADKGQVDKLLTSLHATPKEIRTMMDVETDAAKSKTRELQGEIDAVRQNKVPGLTADTAAANIRILELQHQIDMLHGKNVYIHTITTGPSGGSGQRIPVAQATGGAIYGPGTGTSDSIAARLSNGEHVWTANEVTRVGGHAAVYAMRAAARSGQRVPGFAGGGAVANYAAVAAALARLGASRAGIAGFLGSTQVESHGSTTAHNRGENAWGLQQWEGGRLTELKHLAARMGVSFKSQSAQVAMITRELTHGYRDTLRVLRSSKNARSAAAYVDAHYERSAGTTRKPREDAAAAFYRQLGRGALRGAAGSSAGAAQGVGPITTGRTGGKTVWIFAGQQYASERAAENAQARAEKKQGKLRTEIGGKDIPALMAALTKTTAELVTAERTLSKAAKEAGLTHHALARVAAAEKTLNALSRTRNRIAARLGTPTSTRQTAYERLEASRGNYKGEHDTVASTITGGFDLAQAGRSSGTGVSLDSILGDSAQQKSNAELFNRQLDKLKSMGLGKQELQQLAEKGFAGAESSTLALLGASRKQIGELNQNVSGLGTAAGKTGTFAADLLYGKDVRSAEKQVKLLREQEARVDARMEKIGDRIVHEIGRGLHIDVHIGGEKIRETVRHEVHKGHKQVARAIHLQGGRP